MIATKSVFITQFCYLVCCLLSEATSLRSSCLIAPMCRYLCGIMWCSVSASSSVLIKFIDECMPHDLSIDYIILTFSCYPFRRIDCM